jgi:type II secretory pathway pseudopilin PulG
VTRLARTAFTLIELLLAVSLAMLLVTITVSATLQIRKTLDRNVVRLAMHQRSGLLADQLTQRLSALQQQGALVVEWSNTGTAGTPDPRLRLLFLRGVFDQNDWNYSAYGDYPAWPAPTSSDLVWELWEWRTTNHALYAANSQMVARTFRGKKADGSNLVLNGVNYGNQQFLGLPQPRRTLSAQWQANLNDNILFPATPTDLEHSISLIPGDTGDWSDLRDRLTPMLMGTSSEAQDPLNPQTWDGVSDFGLQLHLRNGTVEEFTATSPYRTLIIPGVCVDGRSATTDGSGTQVLADAVTAGAGRRPDLLRLRWTLRDRKTGIQIPFSFSFPLPGFAAAP